MLFLIGFASMPSSLVQTVTLAPHPETPSRAVRSIDVRVSRTPGILALAYALKGDLERLRLPAPRPRCIADNLWRHTCFEMFIARKDAPGYYEFNLAPSGEWAVYSFERYRSRATLDNPKELDPQIGVRRMAKKLEIDALLHLDRLSPAHARGGLSLALSAIIEHQDGSHSYWALHHPPGKPDFHHPDSFTLELE